MPDQGDGTTRAKVKPQKRKNNEDESVLEGDPHSGGCRPGRVEEPWRSQLLWSFQRRSTWPGQVDSNILQKNSRGLKKSFFCRLSLALEPNTEKMNTAPGMGLKFLRDGVDSANLVADFADCPNQLICLTLFFFALARWPCTLWTARSRGTSSRMTFPITSPSLDEDFL